MVVVGSVDIQQFSQLGFVTHWKYLTEIYDGVSTVSIYILSHGWISDSQYIWSRSYSSLFFFTTTEQSHSAPGQHIALNAVPVD